MLSVIIINHGTPVVTLKCLQHLHKSKGVDFETILINNTPEDKIVFPKVKIINNKNRLGFGANNNQGMKIAKGDKILLLNSDCFVRPDTLARCVRLPYDVVGCRLTTAEGATLPSTGYFPTLRRVAQMIVFFDNLPGVRRTIDTIHLRDTSRLDKLQEVDWVQGAFVMLSRNVYERIGGFDENFYMYGEEIEWQYRMKQAGFHIWYYPETSTVHLERTSIKLLGGSAYSFMGEMKGYLYYFKLHRPKWEQVLLPWVLLFGCAIRIPAWAVWRKWDLVRSYTNVLPQLVSAIFGRTRE